VVAGARVARRGGPRMRRANADDSDEEAAVAADAEERGVLEEAGIKVPDGKIGKKKLEKLQMKADKKLAREADERVREESKKKKLEQEEEDAKRKEKEAEEEKRMREEEERFRAEKERREHEEYLQLKAAFQVEEEGFDEETEEENQENKLKQFIDYIKVERK
jgi:hypothetical protein